MQFCFTVALRVCPAPHTRLCATSGDPLTPAREVLSVAPALETPKASKNARNQRTGGSGGNER